MTRQGRCALSLVCLLGGLLSAGTAGAEPRKCPPGQRPGLHGCVAGSPRARTTASPVKEPQKSAAVSKPAVEREADPRTLDRVADRRLLLAELQRLESLLQVTKKDSPDRPVLLRRLAEGYAELERLAALERETAKVRAERAAREEAEKPRTRATF